MKTTIKTYLWISLLLLASGLWAQEAEAPKVKVSGYLKDLRAAYISTFPGQDLVLDNFLHNRLNFRWFPDEHWTVAVEARTRFFYGQFVALTPGYAELIDYNDYLDLSWTWANGDAVVGHSILDRAYVEYRRGKFEARLGRQRINWGITTVWNPNDIFNAFNFFDWDYEERPGSDALRLQYYTGYASRVELAIKVGETLDEAVIAGLWKFNRWNYDFQLLGGVANGDATLGLGWAGYLGSLGFKGEASYFHPYAANSPAENGISATLGWDYSLANGTYLQLGGLYNSLGATRYDGTNVLSFDVSAKNLFPFRYSVIVQGAYPVSPLFNASFGVLYSPGPHATILLPGLTYSLQENLDLDLLGQLFLVDTGRFESLANVLFLRVKWSF
jgi:hypothetical protein